MRVQVLGKQRYNIGVLGHSRVLGVMPTGCKVIFFWHNFAFDAFVLHLPRDLVRFAGMTTNQHIQVGTVVWAIAMHGQAAETEAARALSQLIADPKARRFTVSRAEIRGRARVAAPYGGSRCGFFDGDLGSNFSQQRVTAATPFSLWFYSFVITVHGCVHSGFLVGLCVLVTL